MEHEAGHRAAEAAAWAHIESVLARGGNATAVVAEFGAGEITSGTRYRFHGDPREAQTFHRHPEKPDFTKAGAILWRPERDTLLPAEDFCKNCEFVRRLASGTEVWRCLGHEAVGPPRGDDP